MVDEKIFHNNHNNSTLSTNNTSSDVTNNVSLSSNSTSLSSNSTSLSSSNTSLSSNHTNNHDNTSFYTSEREIANVVDRLRNAFQSGKTVNVEWRMKQVWLV